jgi:hypothetical protein
MGRYPRDAHVLNDVVGWQAGVGMPSLFYLILTVDDRGISLPRPKRTATPKFQGRRQNSKSLTGGRIIFKLGPHRFYGYKQIFALSNGCVRMLGCDPSRTWTGRGFQLTKDGLANSVFSILNCDEPELNRGLFAVAVEKAARSTPATQIEAAGRAIEESSPVLVSILWGFGRPETVDFYTTILVEQPPARLATAPSRIQLPPYLPVPLNS